MDEKQEQTVKELADALSSVVYKESLYWEKYSGLGTWQFWAVLAILVIPLIVLALAMDRTKAFRLGFYGFAIHIIAFYSDLYATTHKLWEYPFRATPFPSMSFSTEASLIPVAYMLVYQWTINRRKNYYLYLLFLSAGFTFVVKPLLGAADLFWLYKTEYWQLLPLYYAGGLAAKWVADLFHWAERGARVS
ncbi:CBO0543 family protein [Paenibacillus aurantiacus]|uniref:CBO0543 family protein n=1 Tax=Paenibacillus aurantiacus TaxID=1936118 RepID=A0ABV5KN85_9BACL